MGAVWPLEMGIGSIRRGGRPTFEDWRVRFSTVMV